MAFTRVDDILDMDVWRGADDGFDADVQGSHTTCVDFCGVVDVILYGADILECNVDTCRGLRLLR